VRWHEHAVASTFAVAAARTLGSVGAVLAPPLAAGPGPHPASPAASPAPPAAQPPTAQQDAPLSLPDFSSLDAPLGQRYQGLHLAPPGGSAGLVLVLLVALGALALALVLADNAGLGPRHEQWRRIWRRRLQH
jgi:hypothetical protein